MTDERLSYEAAGVSLAVAESVVDRLRTAVESTGATGFGAFAGLHPLGDGRFLAASTDGVGSKLVLARRAGRLRWCGVDLAAHCINDVITTGAEPLLLLDYVAANRIDLEQVAELVDGAAAVCREAGCALVGGETAELPGIYREEELDFAGTCVGIVDADRVIDGSRCRPGDVVLGFPSAGIHANGFTLVRRLVGDDDFDADLLLPPTRLYLDQVRELRARRGREGARARDRRRHPRQPAARPPRRRRGAHRLGLVGAAAGVRLARRAGGRGGRAAARLQLRDRLLRGRAARGRRRGPRHRPPRVIGVLVSGNGTNLQALVDAGLPIAAVASNRRDAHALVRAREAGIPTATFALDCHATREERDLAMATWLEELGVDLVVLAGYLHLLTRPFLDRFPERIVNVHPSLLPAFPGLRAIEQALEAGVETTGVTVHVVDEGLDSGPILAQVPVPVEPRETLETRIHAAEHVLLPRVVGELCAR